MAGPRLASLAWPGPRLASLAWHGPRLASLAWPGPRLASLVWRLDRLASRGTGRGLGQCIGGGGQIDGHLAEYPRHRRGVSRQDLRP